MKDVLAFLKDIRDHNDREWMQANKKVYLAAKDTFHEFIRELIAGISKFDETVLGLEPKDCTFRLNRDIRFSNDKRPYKVHFGAAIMEGGRKSPNPTYYIRVEPGKSFLAGGVYRPEAEHLKKIRQEIDYNAGELKKILEEKKFAKTFGPMTGESLKTAPKGYPKDHPNIEILRLKSFLVTRDLTDKDVLGKDFLKLVLADFEVMSPFNQYLSVAIS